MTDERTWCLDTSALINPWKGYYAPDLAPGYWRTLPEMVMRGRAVVSEEVREEIERADDGLWSWTQANISSWHPLTDEVQAVVTEIMARWTRLVDSRKLRSRADPFVIATAKVVGATVVTSEGYGTENKPQIPYVCGQLDVQCVDIFEFVRLAGIPLV